MQSIAHHLKAVRDSLHAFERKYGREENSVKLLAVSKTRPAQAIREAFDCGQHEFGENYLQEALPKIQAIAEDNISWHFIGPLQSNKAQAVATHFAWIHSLDRLKIARRLSATRPATMPDLNVCIQLNISGETSKSGAGMDQLFELAEQVVALPGLKLRGLMALPAPSNDFIEQRRAFLELGTYFDALVAAGYEVDTLSMGTSHDMEAAISAGATIVRIGTALFGSRR